MQKSESSVPRPNPEQLKYHRQELAAFMHFGMNTFTDSEWGNGQESPSLFNPSGFEARKMVRALKEAGFRKLIITAKHHDGFCLWHTKYTDHSVASSPYGGDILAELSAACSEEGLDMGLYLSPWDVHEPSYGYGEGTDEASDTNGDYNEHYINQILEIASNPQYGRNGRFTEWWLDGAKGTGSQAQEYDFPAWIAAIRQHNPDILIFGAGSEGGIHWVGNESGWAPDQNWCKLPAGIVAGTHLDGEAPAADSVWSIPEVDVSLNAGWFWHEGQEPKSPRQLGDIYFQSVGRGSPLLLNVPPNRDGDYPESYYEALRRFGSNIRNSFGHNAAAGKIVSEEGEDLGNGHYTLLVSFSEPVTFDCVEIKEAIGETGQLIDSVSVEAITENGRVMFEQGGTVGARRLLRGQTLTASGLELKLHSIAGPPKIDTPALYRLTGDFQVQSEEEQLPVRFRTPEVSVKPGETVTLVLERSADLADKEVTLFLDTPPGSAVSGQYYRDRTHERLTMPAGETELPLQLETFDAKISDAKDFFAEISMDLGRGRTGRTRARIVIGPAG